VNIKGVVGSVALVIRLLLSDTYNCGPQSKSWGRTTFEDR